MTKKEIAFTLAKQYAEIERTYWKQYDVKEAAKKEFGLRSEQYRLEINYIRLLRGKMKTLEESVKLLSISDKTWLAALTAAYIENSKAEKAI